MGPIEIETQSQHEGEGGGHYYTIAQCTYGYPYPGKLNICTVNDCIVGEGPIEGEECTVTPLAEIPLGPHRMAPNAIRWREGRLTPPNRCELHYVRICTPIGAKCSQYDDTMGAM